METKPKSHANSVTKPESKLSSSSSNNDNNNDNNAVKKSSKTPQITNDVIDERSPMFVPRSLSFENVLDENKDNYSSSSSLKGNPKWKKNRFTTSSSSETAGVTSSSSNKPIKIKSPSSLPIRSFTSPNVLSTSLSLSSSIKTPASVSSSINSTSNKLSARSTRSIQSTSTLKSLKSPTTTNKSNNNTNISNIPNNNRRRRKQSKTPEAATPLTIRKQSKRGRGSTGSIQYHYLSTNNHSSSKKRNDDVENNDKVVGRRRTTPLSEQSKYGIVSIVTDQSESIMSNSNDDHNGDNDVEDGGAGGDDAFDLDMLDSLLEQSSKSSPNSNNDGINSLSTEEVEDDNYDDDDDENKKYDSDILNDSIEDNLLSICSEDESSESDFDSSLPVSFQQSKHRSRSSSNDRLKVFEKAFGFQRGKNSNDDSISTTTTGGVRSRPFHESTTHDFSTLLSDNDDDDGDSELNMSLTDLMKKLHVHSSSVSPKRCSSLDHLTVQSPTVSTYDQSSRSSEKSSTTTSQSTTTSATVTNRPNPTSTTTSTSPRRRRRSQKFKESNIPSSYSDGELNDFFVGTQHLEDVLSKGGEDALEKALLNLGESLSDPENTGKNNSKTIKKKSAQEGNQQQHRTAAKFLNNSMIASGGNTNKSLDEKYLRAHLKSALIALRSVKAERKDIELNADTLKNELDTCKDFYEIQLNEKEVEMEKIRIELKTMQEEKKEHDLQTTQRECLQGELDDSKGRLLLAQLDVDSKMNIILDLETKLKKANEVNDELSQVKGNLTNKLEVSESRFKLKEEENEKNLRVIELLKTNLDESNSTMSMKEVEVNTYRDLVESLNMELNEMKAARKDICHEESIYKRKNEELESTKAKLESQLKSTSREISGLHEELEECKQELKDKIDRIEIMESDLHQQQVTHDNEVEELKAQSSIKDEKVIEAKEEATRLRNDLQIANDEIHGHLERIDELHQQVTTMSSRFELKDAQIALRDAANNLAAKEEELTEASRRANCLETDLLGANEEIQKHCKTIEVLTNELDNLSKKDNNIERLELDLLQAKEEIQNQSNIIKALKLDMESSSDSTKKIEQLEEDLLKAKEEIQNQHNNIEAMKEELKLASATTKNIQQVERDLLQAKEEILNHCNTIDALKKDLESASQTSNSIQLQLERDLQNETCKVDSAQGELSEARECIARLEVDIQQSEEAIGDIKVKLADEASTVQLQRDKIAALKSSLEESRDRLSTKEIELKEAEEKMQLLQEESDQHQQTIEDLNTELTSCLSNMHHDADNLSDVGVINTQLLEANNCISQLESQLETALDNIVKLKNNLDRAEEEKSSYIIMIDELNTELISQLSVKEQGTEEGKEAGAAGKDHSQNQKSFALLRHNGTDMNNGSLERQVILELVNEIARIKSLEPIKDLLDQDSFIALNSILLPNSDTNEANSLKQESLLSFWLETHQSQQGKLDSEQETHGIYDLSHKSEPTSETYEMERTTLNEKRSLKNQLDAAKHSLQSTLHFAIENLYPSFRGNVPAQGNLNLSDLVESLDILLRSSCSQMKSTSRAEDLEKITPSSPISSHCGYNLGQQSNSDERNCEDKSIEVDLNDGNGSFVAYLKHQLHQNSEIIRTALDDIVNQEKDEMKYDHIEDEDITMIDLDYIDYRKYEFLRRKCDMLEAERDEVLNDTFALLDISKREHKAELEAVTSRVKKEAAIEIKKVTDEFNTRFVKMKDQSCEEI